MLPLSGALALVLALALAGCHSPPPVRDFEPVIARFYLEIAPQEPGAQHVRLPISGVEIAVDPRAVFTEGDIANVELVRVDEFGLCLMFDFNYDAARSLLRISGAHLGRRLVLTLNGKAFGARMIDRVMNEGRLFIFVEMPDEELTATAVNLKRTAQEVQAAIARGRAK